MPTDSAGFVFLDGAAGTMLQKRGLKPGLRPDIMNITAPEAVEEVARMYFEAGSDIIYTNTFGANAAALRTSGYSPGEIIAAAVAITKRACSGKARVALDIGPLGELIDPFGDLTFDDAYELFKEQAVAGEAAGADLAVIETMSELTELKAAITAVRDNTNLPVFATMTFDKNGRTFAGCLPESFAVTAQRLGVSALGLNCSLEPEHMLPIAERIAKMTTLPLIIKPNAGLPDSVTGLYSISPDEFADQMTRYVKLGARFIGGCCGTTPAYIVSLRRAFESLTPSRPDLTPGSFICSPSRFVNIDGYKPSGAFPATAPTYDAAIEAVSRQSDEGIIERADGQAKPDLRSRFAPRPCGTETAKHGIIEIHIPDDPGEAARLVTAVREISDSPALIITGCAEALTAALRTFCGIAAVTFTGGDTDALIKTANKYGAVVI